MDPQPLVRVLADPALDDAGQVLREPGHVGALVARWRPLQRRVVDRAVTPVRPDRGVARDERAARLHGQGRGHGGGGRGTAEEVHEDPVLLLHVLVDEDGHGAAGVERAQDLLQRVLLVDDPVAGHGAEVAHPPVEGGVVERPGHDAEGAEGPAVRQADDLPVAEVGGHEDRAAAGSHGLLHVLAADDVKAGQHLLPRVAAQPEDVQDHLAEVGVDPSGKGMAQVLLRDGHVAPVEGPHQAAHGASQRHGEPPRQPGHDLFRHRRGAVLPGLAPLPVHVALRAAASKQSRNRGSSSICAAIRKTSTGSSGATGGSRTASLAVVTMASARTARASS